MKKILLTLLCFGIMQQVGFSAPKVQIKGSDTLINMVQQLTENYLKKNKSANVAVTGGGSGTGIAALINGRTDIANASRSIKKKEIEKAKKKGFTPKKIVVALDGLSVIVNGSNSVKNLTVEQVGNIFKGNIRNWKEVGGVDMPITLYGRQSSSGTFGFFRKTVLKAEYSSKMNRMNGNSSIVEAIQKDKSGIGYVGVAYVKNKQQLICKIAKKQGSKYTSPLNTKAVYNGAYPLVRPLLQYFNKLTSASKSFIEYELSKEGQQIVKNQGFYPIDKEIMAKNRKALKE